MLPLVGGKQNRLASCARQGRQRTNNPSKLNNNSKRMFQYPETRDIECPEYSDLPTSWLLKRDDLLLMRFREKDNITTAGWLPHRW